MDQPDPLEARESQAVTPCRVHLLCYALLGLILLYVVANAYVKPLFLAEPIGLALTEQAGLQAAGNLDFRLDPNSASWPELDGLPGIGEIMARRIVEYRESQRDAASDRPIFLKPEDLTAVHGIGEKTVARLAPHLRFPAPADPP